MSDHPFDRLTPTGPWLDLVPDSRARNSRAARDFCDDDLAETDVHVVDYLKVLYKRRWTAMTAFLLIMAAVTVLTFTATPIYEASTRLLIESENPNVVSFKAVVDEDQTKQDYYQTQYNILQSRALARRTLDDLKLWDTPPFGAKVDPAFGVRKVLLTARERVTDRVVQVFGSARGRTPANALPGADETAAQTRAIDGLLGNLTVAPVRNSRLVDLKYDLPDPGLATAIVNSVAKNYIEQSLEYKFMASKEASDWLGQRLAEQRKQVEEAEAKLQRYREENDAISLKDRENIVVQKLRDLNAAVTAAKTDRFQKEALYNQLQSLKGRSNALDTFPAILTNSFIQQQKAELANLQSQYAQLGERFGPNHPDMLKVRSAIQLTQSKFDGEIAKIVQSVRNEYQASLAKENSLAAALMAQKGDAMAMNRKAIDYTVLERDVESSRQVYDSLLQRAKETGVSSELKTSNIRVVDHAERPLAPIRPRKMLNELLAILGGAVFACGLAFSFEYMDSRIKSPEEVRVHLGLSHLGLLPALDRKQIAGTYPLVNNGVPARFSEACRAIRTNVLFSSAEEGSRSLVVTSTGPGEGKSLVACNLAVSLAQAGQRVLLIDADMRKPKVHQIFSIEQEPGLSNLLVGKSKPSESVWKSSVAGLWLMPSGRIPVNPAELIGSRRFQEFLTSLSGHFDWVVIDSPPVMAVTDAALAAHCSTAVLFVVGAEMVSRHVAKRAVEQLERAQAKFVGAVLNRVDLDRNAYYYSHYYHLSYNQYYEKTGTGA